MSASVRSVRARDARVGDCLATIQGQQVIDHGPITAILLNDQLRFDRLDIVAADGYAIHGSHLNHKLFVVDA